MTQIIFLVFSETATNEIKTVCERVHGFFLDRKKVFIHCASEKLAHEVDEILWNFDTDKFVPHHILGEGPNPPPPVQISEAPAPLHQRDVLVNLTENMPQTPERFKFIVEIVPSDEKMRENARERFRNYRQKGYNPVTENLD